MTPHGQADRRLLLAFVALAAVMLLWGVATSALLFATLAAEERLAIASLIGDRLPLAAMTLLFVLALAAPGLRALYHHFVRAPARLLDEARALLDADADAGGAPAAQGAAENRALAGVIAGLAGQRSTLRGDIAQQVLDASRRIDEERSRLAALMSELAQSVVVCNLEGRILLYNHRARRLFRALSDAAHLTDGAELIGLGRSIYAVFDRERVAHALDSLRQRMPRGAGAASAQFVTTTPAGHLLRAQMAPVRLAGSEPDGIGGFVLMLDDITREFGEASARDRQLLGLTESSSASLAGLLSAAAALEAPELTAVARERSLRVIRDEGALLNMRLRMLADEAMRGLKTRWPLEDMAGADLVNAALRWIGSSGALRAQAGEVDAAIWLRVDSFSMLQALAWLAGRLADEYGVRVVELRLLPAAGTAQTCLDLAWQGRSMSTETAMTWQMDPMHDNGERTPLTMRDVVERHGGELRLERDRPSHRSFFRFLLPRADERDGLDATATLPQDSRPENYDFDLFRTFDPGCALAERTLTGLNYTVFDTETTGLNPADGDEIIQIGATRIVNGRLLRSESFDQLVDPQRPVPDTSIRIHGIRPDMLHGRPLIADVLPAFHAFAHDTVLVAHNAAFDMRFLELKEALTDVRFDQPVLDTLLLSALLHPHAASHRLEAIAERFDIPLTGRHTALGDAMVTAEVFLRFIPLLAARGIVTLGQALEASRTTRLARIHY